MKLKKAIAEIGAEGANVVAKNLAEKIGIDWDAGVGVVFSAVLSDADRVPGNIGAKSDNETSAIRKWLERYKKGFDGRASQRISNAPGTVSDPVIGKMIGARLTELTQEDLNRIAFSHRLSMSAENILGLILEEYLSEKIQESGWCCAWGETVRSVDFVHADGRLLQIKNRSNSENSSSSSVRDGTKIQKWFRIKADRVEYMWNGLNDICGVSCLSEESFVSFVKDLIERNPNCLAVEKNSPWQ